MSPVTGPREIPGHRFIRLLSDKGGFGDVYLFEEVALSREVAIKVLRHPDLNPDARARFEAEAATMAALEHPHVVRIYATGQTREAMPYISMMYCPKPTMAERALGGTLPLAEVLDIGVAIAGAVESAHRAGVLHRDIKPANILTMPWGAAGLTDFGVAGSLAGGDDDDVGFSIPWSPPEMLFTTTRGSRESDVYSLAATMWHLLVGRSPFVIPGGDNSTGALYSRIRVDAAPGTGRSDVPESLERILHRGLDKDRARRPATVEEFGRALQAVQHEIRATGTTLVILDGPRAEQLGRDDDGASDIERTRRRPALGLADAPLSTSSGVLRSRQLGSSAHAVGDDPGAERDRDSIRSLETLRASGDSRSTDAQTSAGRSIGAGALIAGAAVIAAAALALGYVIFGGESTTDPVDRVPDSTVPVNPGSGPAEAPTGLPGAPTGSGDLTIAVPWAGTGRYLTSWSA